MLSRETTPSPLPTLPPIITNEKDRVFLTSLNEYIETETSKTDKGNAEQRYIVHRDAFDKIIDYVTAYKPLLTAVKAEYEDCIDTIQRGQREAFYLSGKIKSMASEPTTIRNYRKRGDELEQKLAVIDADNEKLQLQLKELRSVREQKEQKAKEIAEPVKREVKRDRRAIPGLTVNQSTDLKVLTRELEKLERQFKELSLSHRTRYSTKEIKNELKDQLSVKVSKRDELAEKTELLKAKRQKLKIAVEAAQAYMKIQPPHQTIGEAVFAALSRASKQPATERGTAGPEEGMHHGTPSTTFEEDDPTREKEAEMMLEYIEKFNELVEDNKYEEAAIHAANSPKGILRTPETLNRFKELKNASTTSGRSPLLAFCDALMSTVLAYGVRPSENMSLECVKCALEENRQDLLSHWISQDRLTVTAGLGELLYTYCSEKPQSSRQCLALAQKVYVKVEAHVPAVVCMVKQGRVSQALEYAKKSRLLENDYLEVLNACPNSSQLVHGLYSSKLSGKPLLPLGQIVYTLLDTDFCDYGLHLLQDVYSSGLKDTTSEITPLRKAIFNDYSTPADKWLSIVQKCEESGLKEIEIELLAAITVLDAVRKGAQNAGEILAAMQSAETLHKEASLHSIEEKKHINK